MTHGPDDLNNQPSIDDVVREIRRQADPTGHPLDLRDLIAECETREPVYPSLIETDPTYETLQWMTQPAEPIDDQYTLEPPPDPIEKVNDYYDEEPPPPDPHFPQFEDWGMSPGGW